MRLSVLTAFGLVAAVVIGLAMASRTPTAQAWPWSTTTRVTGTALCGASYFPVPCSSVSLKMDNGQLFRTSASWLTWGRYGLNGVPVNQGGTLTIGPIGSLNPKMCSKRVWVSKPAAFESLDIGKFTCTY